MSNIILPDIIRINNRHPLARGVVLALPFSENGGFGNNGTNKYISDFIARLQVLQSATLPVWARIRSGWGLQYSGVNGCHSQIPRAGISWNGEFALTFFYKPLTTPGGIAAFIDTMWGNNAAGGFQIYRQTTNTVSFHAGDATGDEAVVSNTVFSSANFPNGCWITLTGNKAQGFLNVYVNGKYDNGITATKTYINGTTNTPYLWLGANNGSNSNDNCVLSNVIIHNRSLTAREIRDLHRDPYVIYKEPLIIGKSALLVPGTVASNTRNAHTKGVAVAIGNDTRNAHTKGVAIRNDTRNAYVYGHNHDNYTGVTALTDFNATIVAAGETVTLDTTNGYKGSNSLKVTTTTTTSNEVGARYDKSAAGVSQIRRTGFRFKIDAAATISGEQCIAHYWKNAYAADLVELRVNSSGSGYTVKLTDPVNAYASQAASKVLNLGQLYKFEIYVTNNSFVLFIDDVFQFEWYGKTNTAAYINSVALGKFYTTGIAGSVYFDDVYMDAEPTLPTAPVTVTAQIADVWAGWKAKYVKSSGMVVRPPTEGASGTSDVVSEGIAYGMLFAVQMNDQTTFDLIAAWAYSNIRRGNNGALTQALYMYGWHYSDGTSTVLDWNFATDADFDIALAYAWAHYKWGDGGTINYGTRLTNLLSDLKSYSFNSDGTQQYQITDITQLGVNPFQQNQSYIPPFAYNVFFQYTADAFWMNALAGAYDSFTKSTDNAGGLATTAGLFPNWLQYSTTSHDVAVNGANDTNFTYDAFRIVYRIYFHWLFFKDLHAIIQLTGALKTFYASEWTRQSKISAEYDHSGTALNGGYEKSMMTFGAYLDLIANDVSNSTGSAIWTNKLTSLYKQAYQGSYYQDAPASATDSYFSHSWMLFGMLAYNSQLTNIGQTLMYSDRNAHTKGVAVAIGNDTRNAHVKGSALGSDTRNAHTKGVAVAIGNDTRNAHTKGVAIGNDTRNAHVKGLALTSDTRNAHVKGSALGSDTRNAHTKGVLTTNATRNAHTKGVAVASDIRSAHTKGVLTTNATRNAHTKGSALAADTKNAHIKSVAATNDIRNAHTKGVVVTSDTRQARVKGTATLVSDTRNARIKGVTVTSDTRSAHTKGSTVTNSSKNARIKGVAVTNDSRNAHVHGVSVQNDLRNAHTHGSAISSDSRSGRVRGQSIASSTYNAHTHGASPAFDFRNARVKALALISSFISGHTKGNLTVSSRIYAHVRGGAIIGDTRRGHIVGTGWQKPNLKTWFGKLSQPFQSANQKQWYKKY